MKISKLPLFSDQLQDQSVDAAANMEEDELNCEPNILEVRYTQITRNAKGELHTVNRPKKYRFSYNKGVIRVALFILLQQQQHFYRTTLL